MESVLTLVAGPDAPLTPALIAEVRHALESLGAETAAPRWLSAGVACDIDFDLLSTDQAEAAARDRLRGRPVDVLAQPAAGRRKRLLLAVAASGDDDADLAPLVRTMQAHGAEAIIVPPEQTGTQEALIAAAAARHLPLRLAAAVGRRAEDLAMLSVAGLGVAFRAAPEVAQAARRRIDHAGITALLFAQGYRAEDIIG